MNNFAITLNSAVSTLEILDKQARKDCGKVAAFSYGVYTVLTSAEAKRKYRIAREVFGRVAEIVGLVAIALCNDLDRWIKAHEQVQPVAPAEISTPVEAEKPAIDSSAILEEIKTLTAPVYARAEVPQMVATPVELSDRELIEKAKAQRVPMARKMGFNRKLSANVRAKLIEAIA